MKPDYKLVAKAKYIHMTADLASEVWHEVYKRYFPAKQLDALVWTACRAPTRSKRTSTTM